jgi:4'-phosphopantetheinyl transferase
MVDVLIAESSVRLNGHQYGELTKKIPSEMIERSLKFRKWNDAQTYLLGKYLLAEGLKKYGLGNQILKDIRYTEYGRPFLQLPVGIDFNISHSGKYVLCAISAGGKVGIDIEEIHNIDIHDFADQLTAEELAWIDEAPDRSNEFFRIWTIKEAVIKADGRGLSIPLKEIVIGPEVRVGDKVWKIHQLDMNPAYMAHIVVEKGSQDIISLREITISF